MQEPVKPTSRNIDLPIKRVVRQRCGFGCVICGSPLYEYEHMLGWSLVHRHVAEEITLLCDQHHKEKTNGLLPIEEVREANENPYNLRVGVSKPYDLHFRGDICKVQIGSSGFSMSSQGIDNLLLPVSIDGLPLVMFQLTDGHLLLTLRLFDENNSLVLEIVDNQLIYSVSPWDIELVGRNLIIREAKRKILFDVVFEVPNKIVIKRGRFIRNKIELLVTPEYTLLLNNNSAFNNIWLENCQAGFLLGPHPEEIVQAITSLFYMPQIPRYISDRKASIGWVKEAFKDS